MTKCRPSQSRGYSGSLSKRYTWPGELSLATLQCSRNGGTHSTSTLSCSASRFGRIRRAGGFSTNSSISPYSERHPLEELPSPSTLCKAFNRLNMTVWRVLPTSPSYFFQPTVALVSTHPALTAVTPRNTIQSEEVDDSAVENYTSCGYESKCDP